MVTRKKQTHYFLHDDHGSARCLTDESGTVLDRYDYDAFGNAIGFEPANALTRFLYCGELFDHKLGWTYLRARYYDPKVGRFNRLDPFFGVISDPQSLHKYTYCHGDPVNNHDPNGMFLAGFVGGFGGMMTSLMGRITIAAGISTFANLAISGLSFFRATNYFMQQGRSIPDGLVITGFYSGATRGVAYGAGINLYLSLNPPGLYLYLSGEAGLAPLSFFKGHNVSGKSALGWGWGLVFNSKSPDDIAGPSINAYWPINAMLGASGNSGFLGKDGMIDRFLRRQGWNAINSPISYLLALARHANSINKPRPTYPGGGFKKYYMEGLRGTLHCSTALNFTLDDGATILGYQNRAVNFGTTISYSSKPMNILSCLASLPDSLRYAVQRISEVAQGFQYDPLYPESTAILFERLTSFLPDEI